MSVRSGLAPPPPDTFILAESELELVPPVAGRPRRRPGRDTLIVGGLILVGMALRAPTLTRAYWVDEGISVGIASHRLSQIPDLLRLDGSPPLYYALLHPWLQLFGTSEFSVHSISLLISVAVIPAAWWSARELFGPAAGLAAAVLATTNPFLAWYGTESRMYPLACGLALVGVAMAMRALRDRRLGDVVWATMAFGLLMYTHNWGLYLVAATAIVLAAHAISRRDVREFVVVASAAAALGLLYLPWLPTFIDQAGNTAAPWAIPPSFGDLFADPASVLGGTLGALIAPLLIAGVIACLVELEPGQRRLGLMVLAISGVAVAEGWLAAQIEPSWASRYLAVALGPALLALGGLLGATRRGRRVVLVVAVPLAAWSVVGSLIPDPNARYAKSNVAAVVGVAAERLRPGDLVVVTQTEQLAVVAHYAPAGLHFATPQGPVTDPYVVDWRHLTSRLEHSDPCLTLGPALDALPVGAHVLVVNPLKPIGAAGSRWSTAAKYQVDLINRMLFKDPALHPIKSFDPAAVPKPFSPVVGLLFAKTSGSTLCP